MVVKAERRKTARKLVCQDLHPMAKATLSELQSPAEAHQLDGKLRLIPVSARVESDWVFYQELRACHLLSQTHQIADTFARGANLRRQTENLRGAQRER